MYIPDRVFEKRLKDYDRKLSVRWVPRRERWGIYRAVPSANRLYERNVLIMLVQNKDNSYRPLDGRTLFHLRSIDNHIRSEREILREIEEHNDKREQAELKSEKEDIEAITRDIAPTVKKEMESETGSRNLPAEDYHAMMERRYGKEKLEEILS